MNKEFIPYEQALELKKLGFNEPCFFAFDNCSTPMRCTDLRTNEQQFYGVNYNSSTYTSQPTYSQAFRWFREKYKIVHEIQFGSGKIWIRYGYNSFVRGLEVDNNNGEFYHTYEEAEFACLKQLIEIVKNK